MSASRPHLLLVNPSAGRGRVGELLPAEAALAERGIEYRVVLTESVDDARTRARDAVDRDEVVVVMSGDGMIGQVGGELAGTQTPLAVIPGGRGNDFARVIGIPVDEDGMDVSADVFATASAAGIRNAAAEGSGSDGLLRANAHSAKQE